MKLEFVEIEGFRGFRQRARFEIPAGFLVITGRNGVGKSTILDAIDFALTGSINKYDVEKAKGGGLAEHIWWVGEGRAATHYVRVGFIDDLGERRVVTRFRDKHNAEGLVEALNHIQDTQTPAGHTADAIALMDTTLIRDEIISASSLDLPGQQRFNMVKAAIGSSIGPDHTQRTGEILAEATAALADEQRTLNLHQAQLRQLLAQLTEARTEASKSTDIAEALQLVAEAAPSRGAETSAEDVRSMVADRRAALARFNRARARSAEISEQRVRVRSDAFKQQVTAAEVALQQASSLLPANQQNVDLARRVVETEQQSDVQGARFAALLEHGSALGLQAGHCPLCDAMRTDAEFAAALDAIRTRLAGQAERIEAANQALAHAQAELHSNQAAIATLEGSLDGLRGELAAVDAADLSIRTEYDAAGFTDVPIDDLRLAEARAAAEQQRVVSLERAALILDASTAVDRVSSLQGQIARLREQIDRSLGAVSEAENALETARQIDSAAKSLENEILVEQFETVMPLLQEVYQRLRPHTDWTEIDADFGGKVRGSLNFSVGDGRNPQFLFSSGQRRAAGLAFLLAVHLSRPWCRWHSLLLDDPVQHVDDYRALNVVEVLAAIRRSGRQIVVAVEDPALADLLCRRLRSSPTQPGRRYDLAHGPDGSGKIDTALDILPLPLQALPLAIAS
jgi:DNA repair exonuclease SbcCD ATPase subunit